jgi:hypothetical protein
MAFFMDCPTARQLRQRFDRHAQIIARVLHPVYDEGRKGDNLP